MQPADADGAAFLAAIESHDDVALRALLAGGFDATSPLRGKTPVQWLLEMYLRSPRFAGCLRLLLAAGADLEARARDGHTPLFHTVNSILDHGAPVLRALLAAGARTDVCLPSLVWGRGFDWETTLYDVTPINYCQAGLLPQFHRREADVYRNLGLLLAAAGRAGAPFSNVPNRYLQPPQGGSR